ncbi:hypothetical protein HDV00_012573 [Rhizophlyctis rosea]|nr:hypothetical protein HDV00_012573 [Rhizophlyctis rosea]
MAPDMDTPLRPSPEVTELIGISHPISRTGVLSCIYAYAKAKALIEMPFITCDEKLRKVFGGVERVHAFAVLSYLEPHLTSMPELSDYILVDSPSTNSTQTSSPPEPNPSTPTPTAAPVPWPQPTLIIKTLDHSPNGTLFTTAVPEPLPWLRTITTTVLQSLYAQPQHAPTHVSFIRLVIRDMEGVAYCSDADPDPANPAETGKGKQIHLSTRHIRNTAGPKAGKGGVDEDLSWVPALHHEITGVILHESVHAWQHNALGSCPGGLIEGIADFIRLKAGWAPPHWHRGKGGNWDDGYSTTGYFLEWIEETKKVEGFVRSLNLVMEDVEWDEGVFRLLCECGVEELWEEYQRGFEGESLGREERDPVPTHGV